MLIYKLISIEISILTLPILLMEHMYNCSISSTRVIIKSSNRTNVTHYIDITERNRCIKSFPELRIILNIFRITNYSLSPFMACKSHLIIWPLWHSHRTC